MLAKLSELNMQQQMAAALGEKVQQLREEVKTTHSRVAQGLAPSDAIEKEYMEYATRLAKSQEEDVAIRQACIGPNGEARMYLFFCLLYYGSRQLTWGNT